MAKYTLFYSLSSETYNDCVVNRYHGFLNTLLSKLQNGEDFTKCALVSTSKSDEDIQKRIEYINRRYVERTHTIPIYNGSVKNLNLVLDSVEFTVNTGDITVDDVDAFRVLTEAFRKAVKEALDENDCHIEDRDISMNGIFSDKYFMLFNFDEFLRLEIQLTVPTDMYKHTLDENEELIECNIPADYDYTMKAEVSISLNNFKVE